MNDTSDDTGGSFDPQRAAALLNQTTMRARSQLAPGSPMLWSFRAVMVLVGLGGCWLSVRGQQPYSGPTAPAIAVLFALIAINVGWSSWRVRRMATSVTGPAQRTWQAWGGVMLAVLIISFVIVDSSYHVAVTQPTWALYPVSGPILIVGVAGLASSLAFPALRYQPSTAALAAIAIVAVIAGFAGPVGEFLVMAIGLFVVCVGAAVFKTWLQRRSLVRS